MSELFITGAGVSSESGIPTFRGQDGYWTVGSKNYTPQEMATRAMYLNHPQAFLHWYYKRFISYLHHGPNLVHHWLSDKNLITQNIDGLDAKAGNTEYISIHGRIDLVTPYHIQGEDCDIKRAPWEQVDESKLDESLLDIFKIGRNGPELNVSLKPYVLLFDEFYSDLYQISKAERMMQDAEKMVFMGTSFSVNITQIALNIAASKGIPVEVVDPKPVKLNYPYTSYKTMSAYEYVQSRM